MVSHVDKNYGADADGNRGITVIDYELTTDDTPAIREEIFDLLRADDYDYTDSITVVLIDTITENEIEFRVAIQEYITKNQFDKIQGSTE